MKSKVYFSKTISPEKIIELIELSGKKLPGSIAVKVHSGEVGQPELPPSRILETCC